jgi:hypothetical protein
MAARHRLYPWAGSVAAAAVRAIGYELIDDMREIHP